MNTSTRTTGRSPRPAMHRRSTAPGRDDVRVGATQLSPAGSTMDPRRHLRRSHPHRSRPRRRPCITVRHQEAAEMVLIDNTSAPADAGRPMLDEPGSRWIVVVMAVMVVVPFLALMA